MEEKLEYDHEEILTKSFYDFPLDHPDVTLNKSIEDFEEFEQFMDILSKHKESSSPLTSDGGGAIITE